MPIRKQGLGELEPAEGHLTYTRLQHEPEVAWIAFKTFRDLTKRPRTTLLAVRAAGLGDSMVTAWSGYSRAFDWAPRVAEYDRDQDEQEIRARLEQIKADHKNMRAVGQSMWVLAAKEISKWHQMVELTADGRPILTVKEIVSLADAGIKITRLLDGETKDAAQLDREATKQLMQIGDLQIWF